MLRTGELSVCTPLVIYTRHYRTVLQAICSCYAVMLPFSFLFSFSFFCYFIFLSRPLLLLLPCLHSNKYGWLHFYIRALERNSRVGRLVTLLAVILMLSLLPFLRSNITLCIHN